MLNEYLEELSERCNSRQQFASSKNRKSGDYTVNECEELFNEVLSFTASNCKQIPMTNSVVAPPPDDAKISGECVGATCFLGDIEARRYFDALSVRQTLMPRLSRAGLLTGTPHGEQSPVLKLCSQLSHEILAFGNLATSPDLDSQEPEKSLKTAYSNLLDFLDLLTLMEPADVMRFAESHAGNGRTGRARSLLRKHLYQSPDDVPARLMLGCLLFARKRYHDAADEFIKVLELQPQLWSAQRHLGLCQMRILHLDDAIISLGTAKALLDYTKDATDSASSIGVEIRRAKRLREALTEAEDEAQMPMITLEDEEIEQGSFHPETLSVAVELYLLHGTLCIQNAFDPAVIKACREQFLSDYREYLSNDPRDDALKIGHRRFQVSIALHGHFNQPEFYANPFVIALMRALINPKVIIGSTVCATSLPGARDQHLHKDHRALFTEGVDDKPIRIPPVAITTMIPLVALDEEIGTTLVKKGSHRESRKVSEKMPYQTPIVGEGGCFFMDLALSHKGQGNHTSQVRPIVNMVYSQRWFADNKNFKLQPPLQISSEEFARIPKNNRPLVDWAVQPGPRVNR